MKNDSLTVIADRLKQGHKILLYPHVHMDGDALGSCTALALALRKLGKDAWVFAGETVPENLAFMAGDLCVFEAEQAADADVAVCVDNGDPERLTWRKETFLQTPFTICIDHHGTSTPYCNLNHIDPGAAATGQLVYHLILALGVTPDREIGNRIYGAIATDTGNFRYSNTQQESFQIIADLYPCGITPYEVANEIYENDRMERIRIEAMAMETLEMLANGQVAMAYVDQAMMASSGAMDDETDSIVPRLRSMRGVEVACFLKERGPSEVKVSLRSKKWVDVGALSALYQGGGHMRAAGFTLYASMEEALRQMREKLEEVLAN